MKTLLKKLVDRRGTKRLIAWMFVHARKLLPITPLRENAHWVAFCHPAPAYPVHILIVPKAAVSNWLVLDAQGAALMADFVSLSQSMIRDFELEPAGYRLIMNGGPNQTFPQLHFHLVAGDQLSDSSEE